MPQSNRLSAAQRAALTAISAGRTIRDAARAAGVDRSSVHRWMRSTQAFQVAMEEAQLVAQAACEASIAGLGEKAVEVLRLALDRGDVRVAIVVATGLGLLGT